MNETAVFRALADPTRRAIFECLGRGELNVAEIKAGVPVSYAAVSQHLAALREAGLVSVRRQGRSAYYRINPGGLEPLVTWTARYSQFWPERMEKLKDVLKGMDQ